MAKIASEVSSLIKGPANRNQRHQPCNLVRVDKGIFLGPQRWRRITLYAHITADTTVPFELSNINWSLLTRV